MKILMRINLDSLLYFGCHLASLILLGLIILMVIKHKKSQKKLCNKSDEPEYFTDPKYKTCKKCDYYY